jgi:hypothetical protein
MNAIDRRSLMIGTTSLMAALALPGGLAANPIRPALFITDSRIAAGRGAAQDWRAAGVRVIDRANEDLGQAWHSAIPVILQAGQARIAGLTLWVDSYICETFGREHGLAMERTAMVPGDTLHAWMLKPRQVQSFSPVRAAMPPGRRRQI